RRTDAAQSVAGDARQRPRGCRGPGAAGVGNAIEHLVHGVVVALFDAAIDLGDATERLAWQAHLVEAARDLLHLADPAVGLRHHARDHAFQIPADRRQIVLLL